MAKSCYSGNLLISRFGRQQSGLRFLSALYRTHSADEFLDTTQKQKCLGINASIQTAGGRRLLAQKQGFQPNRKDRILSETDHMPRHKIGLQQCPKKTAQTEIVTIIAVHKTYAALTFFDIIPASELADLTNMGLLHPSLQTFRHAYPSIRL